jgi:hypothetical protein
MSFTRISHDKVFNMAIWPQVYVYLLIFSRGVLQRDIRDMKYADIISSKLSHFVIGVFL